MKNFILEQKITVMVNQYTVFSADSVENKQEEVAFAHQKRLAFKEKFDFFTDATKQHILFSVNARKVLDLGTRYDVTDASGKVIGVLGKSFKASLLRSTWNVFKPGQEDTPQIIAQERSKGLALFRRIWTFLPYIGDFPFFLKYHFDFRRPNQEKVVVEYNKITTFRDHYLLRVHDEIEGEIDWRVLIALGVLMDALQSR